MNYVRVPKDIILNKELGKYRVCLFSYLCCKRSADDTVFLNLPILCEWTGAKSDTHAGKINQKYAETLYRLSDTGYIKDKLNENTFPYNFQHLYRFVNLNIEKFDIPNNYGIIYYDELKKIINFKKELSGNNISFERISASHILIFLAYIRSNLYYKTDKPRCCYRFYKNIAEEIGFSERVIGRIVEILKALNILESKEGARLKYQKSDGTDGYLTNYKVFADCRKFIQDENGEMILDENYSPDEEIEKQMKLLSAYFKKDRE